jgi:hypothetical protein
MFKGAEALEVIYKVMPLNGWEAVKIKGTPSYNTKL